MRCPSCKKEVTSVTYYEDVRKVGTVKPSEEQFIKNYLMLDYECDDVTRGSIAYRCDCGYVLAEDEEKLKPFFAQAVSADGNSKKGLVVEK